MSEPLGLLKVRADVLRTSLFYFGIRGINGVLSIASVLILSRLLSPEQYGAYSLLLATISILATTLFQWLAAGVSRLYASYSNSVDGLLLEAYRLFCLVAIVILILGAAIAKMICPDLEWAVILVVAIGSVALGLHSLNLQIANASLDKRRYALLSTTRAFLAPVLAVCAIASGLYSYGAAAGFVLGALFSSLLFHARVQPTFNQINPQARRDLITFGLPLVVSLFATTILDLSDRFIIAAFLGQSAVGVYAATYDITQQTMGVALNVLYLAAFPKITRAWESSGSVGASAAMQSMTRSLVLLLPITLSLIIGLSPELARLLFDGAMEESSGAVMPWVAIAISIGCVKSYFLDVGLSLQKRTQRLMQITVMMAIINVALNVLFIPVFGLQGAAVATAVAFLCGAAASAYSSRHLDIFGVGKRDLVISISASLTIIAALRIMPAATGFEMLDMLLKASAVVLFYLMFVYLLNLAGVRSDFRKFLSMAARSR